MAESIAGPSRLPSECPGLTPTPIKLEGFTVVYRAEGDILADVVFVHGLGGHAERTWTKESLSLPDRRRKIATVLASIIKRGTVKQTSAEVRKDIFWPRDLLPLKVGNIRILTYGYDSKVVHGRNKNGIYEHAENMLSGLERIRSELPKDWTTKIIFVAHSLGGVIVKEVLRQSSNHTHQPHLLAIFHDTYGVIFLGCPHRGSSATEWGVIAANIAKLAGISSNTALLRSLGTDSQSLTSLSLDFSRYLKDHSFKVHSFREEQGMTGIAGISGKVVQDASSIIGDSAEGKEGINTNHRDMSRFQSQEDEGFLKIAAVISRYVQDLVLIRTSFDQVARDVLENERKRKLADLTRDEIKCLQSLALADYSTHRGRIPARCYGTLEWLLKHEVYNEWDSKDTSSALLWISGNPGCGKTVMSAFLLDHLEIRKEIADVKVAFFFCDDKEKFQRSGLSLLRGVIHQLITASPCLIKHAMETYRAHGVKMLESLHLLWDIFIYAATDPICDGTYIVLDALDECEKVSRDYLLRQLNSYFPPDYKSARSFLKVLITSRPYREIELQLAKHRIFRLKTEHEWSNIQADISMFISQKVDEMEEICHYDSELKEKVRTKLKAGADGMFLWVALVIQELLDTPISLVSEALENTPNSLHDLYIHLLKRLAGRKAKIARTILVWVVMAPQPMALTELAVACAIKSTDQAESSIDRSVIAGFEHDIALCGPILKVQHGMVYLVHQSVKDFLLDPGLHESIGDFNVIPERASHELAITCLTYLSFDNFEPESPDIYFYTPESLFEHIGSVSMLTVGRKQNFHAYAAVLWPQFIHQTDEGDPDICTSFCRLAKSSGRLNLAFPEGGMYRPVDALYISAYFGLCSITRHLLSNGADINAAGGLYGSVLQAAAHFGHYEVIIVLLKYHANVNAHGGNCGYALHAAALQGHERVVLVLLNHGANIEATDQDSRTALQAAAMECQERVVSLLLKHGANVDAPGGRYGNALEAAARRGHMQVVLLLLNHRAAIEAPTDDYRGALNAAANQGHERVVGVLLEHDAQMSAADGSVTGVLEVAAMCGHDSVVKLLLQRGAKLTTNMGDYGNAFHMAVMSGHALVVLRLLEHGVNINVHGGYYGNALQVAANRGNEGMVRLLLEHGACVNAQGGHHGNALQATASQGRHQVVQLLLDHGARVNEHGGHDGNALQAARKSRSCATVNLLIASGARDRAEEPVSRGE